MARRHQLRVLTERSISTISIQRSRWVRGVVACYMVTDAGHKDVVGHYLTRCGMPLKQLLYISHPGSILLMIPQQARWVVEESSAIFSIQDDPNLSPKEMEQKLISIFKAHNITLKFAGKDAKVASRP